MIVRYSRSPLSSQGIFLSVLFSWRDLVTIFLLSLITLLRQVEYLSLVNKNCCCCTTLLYYGRKNIWMNKLIFRAYFSDSCEDMNSWVQTYRRSLRSANTVHLRSKSYLFSRSFDKTEFQRTFISNSYSPVSMSF